MHRSRGWTERSTARLWDLATDEAIFARWAGFRFRLSPLQTVVGECFDVQIVESSKALQIMLNWFSFILLRVLIYCTGRASEKE